MQDSAFDIVAGSTVVIIVSDLDDIFAGCMLKVIPVTESKEEVEKWNKQDNNTQSNYQIYKLLIFFN